ncbi:MAG: homoserine O-succinyltransferase [Alphaproteobacteria bacterium]|nr:homoserine O-succinyltransferase [Alphaproteobacteria bacterium]
MPLIAHNDLPSFQRLREEGRTVLEPGRALTQEIRELHIGLLNMMPDAALEATERQFLRLIGESNKIAQFYVHPFTLPEIKRGKKAQTHIDKYYEPFEKIKKEGLDALIITGANIVDPDLSKAPFWQPLQDVIDWAWNNATSTLCSCLATHAVMEFKYGQKRSPMRKKLWGVYPHRLTNRTHPLIRGVNTVFDVPHSRHNTITQKQFEAANMRVLSAGKNAGVHLATSPDGFRMICFQGHPEYDTISLYKEYKRELLLHIEGKRKDAPPLPEHYFNREMKTLLTAQKKQLKKGKPWSLSDEDVYFKIDNSWRDSARAIVGNWIGLAYQLTNMDRKLPFMEGIDPDNPLGLPEKNLP